MALLNGKVQGVLKMRQRAPQLFHMAVKSYGSMVFSQVVKSFLFVPVTDETFQYATTVQPIYWFS